ncbi:MAG: type III-A CRISPR-associated RAMP protein Csm4 [Bacteroidota bacterium]
MKTAYIPLQPYSRFHFGELREEDKENNLALSTTSLFAHSDTLFSGLIHSYSRLTGSAQGFVESFRNADIKISSLCYYLSANGATVHFLPKPVSLEAHSFKRQDGKHKERNAIQFVSVGTWKNGFAADYWFQEEEYQIIHKKFVLTRQEFDDLGLTEEVFIASVHSNPKSPIRAEEDSSIFYRADVEIGGSDELQVGWFFLYEAEEQHEKDLLSALNVLAYTGIGGEVSHIGRTIPLPPFSGILDLNLNKPARGYINVSLFCPKDQNDLDKVIYARTMLRGGRKFVHGGQANVIRMIREGALFKDETAEGSMVELGRDIFDREVYRNGVPFLVPIY